VIVVGNDRNHYVVAKKAFGMFKIGGDAYYFRIVFFSIVCHQRRWMLTWRRGKVESLQIFLSSNERKTNTWCKLFLHGSGTSSVHHKVIINTVG
jgi:hypothetical protein